MWGELSCGEFALGRVVLGRVVFGASCPDPVAPRVKFIGQVGMTSLQVNCSLAEVNALVFIAVF